MNTTEAQLQQPRNKSDRRLPDWVPILGIALLSAGMFGFASYMVGYKFGQDFPAHLRWAQMLAEEGVIYLPHYTYQQLVVILRALLPIGATELIHQGLSTWLAARSYKIAGLLVAMIFYALLAVILYRRFLIAYEANGSKFSRGLAFITALGLMLVAPINLLTLSDHRLYLGYIGINVFHNPTVIMLKPMALVLFWTLLDRGMDIKKQPHTIWLVLLTIFSTLTKPNFSLCLLPVIILWMLYRWWKKQPLQVYPLVLGFILPAILVLGYQYWFGFLQTGNTRVVFAPLLEMKFYAPSGLVWMFILSFLFPVTVLACQFRRVVQDQPLLIAWGAFLVGSAMTYLLAEVGGREYNLNFEWGAQVGLFILFTQSLLFLINNWRLMETDNKPTIPRWQKNLLGFVLGLHLLSGVIWYFAEVLQPLQWWR
jgi:hypothetical protein